MLSPEPSPKSHPPLATRRPSVPRRAATAREFTTQEAAALLRAPQTPRVPRTPLATLAAQALAPALAAVPPPTLASARCVERDARCPTRAATNPTPPACYRRFDLGPSQLAAQAPGRKERENQSRVSLICRVVRDFPARRKRAFRRKAPIWHLVCRVVRDFEPSKQENSSARQRPSLGKSRTTHLFQQKWADLSRGLLAQRESPSSDALETQRHLQCILAN